jgi:hypothetical protein
MNARNSAKQYCGCEVKVHIDEDAHNRPCTTMQGMLVMQALVRR